MDPRRLERTRDGGNNETHVYSFCDECYQSKWRIMKKKGVVMDGFSRCEKNAALRLLNKECAGGEQ